MSSRAFRAMWPARFARVAFLAAVVNLTGCMSMYVDGATKEVPVSQFRKPASPAPVQLLFEFQTKGVANARATEHLKPQVTELVRGSELFSKVEETPLAGAGLLSVTLNNVVLTDDVFSKGFVTGMTFGLAGSQVSDGYICTVSYLAPGASTPVVKTARHAIHTTMGAAKSPGNAQKAANPGEAVRTMTRQVLSTALNELSQDSALAGN